MRRCLTRLRIRPHLSPLLVLLLLVTGCGASIEKKAYNSLAALSATYQTAAPMRAEMCRAGTLPPATCESSLNVLKGAYTTLKNGTSLLATYLETKEEGLAQSLSALLPAIVNAALDVEKLIKELKS